MTFICRDAEKADAAAIDRVFQASFCDTFAHLYEADDLDAFLSDFSLEDWEDQIGDPAFAFRIAKIRGEAVGYVKLGPVKPEIETTRPAVLLDQLYILKAYHGTGIAQQLMDWSIDEARLQGAKSLILTVYIDNHRARRFYERYGFEAVGRYEFMVGNHADEDIIMQKLL